VRAALDRALLGRPRMRSVPHDVLPVAAVPVMPREHMVLQLSMPAGRARARAVTVPCSPLTENMDGCGTPSAAVSSFLPPEHACPRSPPPRMPTIGMAETDAVNADASVVDAESIRDDSDTRPSSTLSVSTAMSSTASTEAFEQGFTRRFHAGVSLQMPPSPMLSTMAQSMVRQPVTSSVAWSENEGDDIYLQQDVADFAKIMATGDKPSQMTTRAVYIKDDALPLSPSSARSTSVPSDAAWEAQAM